MKPKCSIGLSDAVLLVVGRPVSLLAVLAAVHYKATSGTGQELGSIFFGHEAVAANLSMECRILFRFLRLGSKDGRGQSAKRKPYSTHQIWQEAS